MTNQWLVIEDQDGAVESIALDGVEAISCAVDGATYIMRRGLPPKGFLPRQIYVANEPAFGSAAAARRR